MESEDVSQEVKDSVQSALRKGRKKVETASKTDIKPAGGVDGVNDQNTKKRKVEGGKGNAGARILLGKIKA